MVQTTIPATTLYSTTLVTSTESPTGIAGLQSDGLTGSSNGGLSTGAKAGIGAGVGVAVVAAAILGALYAMRRRKRHDQMAESDRYSASIGGPSYMGGVVGGLGKTNSRYSESEMRESNPLDRYTSPIISSQGRTTIPPNSRTSDISSVSGSEPTTFRPGPGMPVVAEQQTHPHQHQYANVEELEDRGYSGRSQPDYLVPGAAYNSSGNPFHEKGDNTPSLYSEDGDVQPQHGQSSMQHHPSVRQASPAALELSGENTLIGSGSVGSAGQGYRGMDPEQPYHTRSQLTKPLSQQRQYDPSQNF